MEIIILTLLQKKRIELVNKLYEEGKTIIIEASRGSKSCKTTFFTVNQLKSWGVKFRTVGTGLKIGADLFIDDKEI